MIRLYIDKYFLIHNRPIIGTLRLLYSGSGQVKNVLMARLERNFLVRSMQ